MLRTFPSAPFGNFRAGHKRLALDSTNRAVYPFDSEMTAKFPLAANGTFPSEE